MSVTLDIPDDVFAVLPTPQEKRDGYLPQEIACALIARDLLSLGRAVELAGVITFGREVGGRGIARHYNDSGLEADLAYGRGH